MQGPWRWFWIVRSLISAQQLAAEPFLRAYAVCMPLNFSGGESFMRYAILQASASPTLSALPDFLSSHR